MSKIKQIREWKQKWGYDDFAVMPGGRPMKAFAPDRAALDRLADKVANDDAAQAERIRARAENPAARRLKALAMQLDEEGHAPLLKDLKAEIDRIRLTEDVPDAALLTRLAEALHGVNAEVASSLEEWQEDLAHPYDPAQGPLATSIAERIRNRNILDRTAAVDQVTGKIYSTDRREELQALTGNHYLAKAFGLRAIREESTQDQARSGILFDHPASSKYQRDALEGQVTASMKDLYDKAQATNGLLPAYSPAKVFFVNSADVAAKLSKTYTSNWTDPKTSKSYAGSYLRTVAIKPGVFALIMSKGVDGGFKTRLLEGSGSTPSAYQVEKARDDKADVDPLTDPTMRGGVSRPNDEALVSVTGSAGCRRLAQLPDDSPLKQASLAASTLVTGLGDALGKLRDTPKWDAVKDNKLVANALEKIERLMETMPSYTEDVPRFSRLFDLLVDEVYLVLATCKPYGKDDFKAAADAMITERIPTLGGDDMVGAGVTHSTALLSGGMDGLSTAVAAAFTATGAQKLTLIDGGGDHSSNYFEIEANLLGSATKGPMGDAVRAPGYKPPVIMGTLNPSTPVKQAKPGALPGKGDASWSVDKLIGKINEVLALHLPLLQGAEAIVAIIDVTVERQATGADQEMDKLVADATIKQALKDGKLTLMLAKSYQKYPALGAGKTMAGGLTVVGKGIRPDAEPLKTVAHAEAALGMLPADADPGYDESQILTHFMTHERDAERKMMARAAKNAGFLRSLLPADGSVSSPKMRYDAGLPFLVFKKEGLKVEKPGGGDKFANVSTTLFSQGIEERMSFGFQNTSCLGFGDLMRIGVGQESEEDLVEKLYAVTHLAARGAPGGISPNKTVAMAAGIANQAMDQAKAALEKRDPGEDGDVAWRERMVKVLSAAGTLKSSEIKRDKANGKLIEPGDAELTRRLKAIADDTRTEANTPEKKRDVVLALGRKLAVVTALRQSGNSEPALALSTTRTADMSAEDRGTWILDAEKALRSRDITLPARPVPDEGDKRYIEALRGALHDADDANLMHAHARKGWGGPGGDQLKAEAQYLPNMVASCANLIFTSLNSPKDFMTLSDVLIEHGLEDLSPEGCERLLFRRVQASLQGSKAEILADVSKLEKVAAQMPYREGLANLVKGQELEVAVAKGGVDAMDDDEIGQLVKALTKPLDITTQCDLFDKLVELSGNAAKKKIAVQHKAVLAARFEELARAYEPEPVLATYSKDDLGTGRIPKPPPAKVGQPVKAQDIRRGSTAPGEGGPKPMSQGEFEALKQRFDVTAALLR